MDHDPFIAALFETDSQPQVKRACGRAVTVNFAACEDGSPPRIIEKLPGLEQSTDVFGIQCMLYPIITLIVRTGG